MTKLVVKIIIMIVVMLGVSNYVLYIMTGKTPFTSDSLPSLDTVKDLTPAIPAGKDTAYKWVDEKGVVHFSTEPPPEEQQAERLEVDPNVNVIKSVKPREQESPETAPAPELQSPYTPEGAKKLIDDARNVQKLLDDRYEKQKEIIDSQ